MKVSGLPYRSFTTIRKVSADTVNSIRHRVKERVPQLLSVTVCGQEFGDCRVKIGDSLMEPVVPAGYDPVAMPSGPIPTISRKEFDCMICWPRQ